MIVCVDVVVKLKQGLRESDRVCTTKDSYFDQHYGTPERRHVSVALQKCFNVQHVGVVGS